MNLADFCALMQDSIQAAFFTLIQASLKQRGFLDLFCHLTTLISKYSLKSIGNPPSLITLTGNL
jgi:hypothetical protein